MKHIIRKYYINNEKEEQWLNDLSAKGLALSDYSWCRYVFEEAPAGEYIYRIELLEQSPTHPESVAYLKFLEDTGIECVATYMSWVYLRKKAADGAFEVYTDIESKIKHYKRIHKLWLTLMWLEFITGFYNLLIGSINYVSFHHRSLSYVNLGAGIFLICLGIVFTGLTRPVHQKIVTLKQEQAIRE